MHSLRSLPVTKMKRQRASEPAITSNQNPNLPPTPQTHHLNNPKPITISSLFRQTKRTLVSKTPKSQTPLQNALNWEPLNLSKSELYLTLTFPTGQTFRWKQTGSYQFTGVVKSHLVSLKQLDNGDGGVAFCVHQSSDESKVRDDLNDFLNAGISLAQMWETFSASDSRFSDVASCLVGARVLRQDPVECLMQFLCSSNNNIGRITGMVNFISSLGNYLGTVEGFDFHEFPSLERLSLVSSDDFRAAGFGYRAKYIVGTVKALQSKPGGGAEWLASLRSLDLNEVVEALCTLPGVGPKVAACIALFSLDQHHAIPVDTHVWQIATRYLMPELANARLTPKLSLRVAEVFVSKFGKYAGWAQTVLFIAELPSQKALLPQNLESPKKKKSVKTIEVKSETDS